MAPEKRKAKRSIGSIIREPRQLHADLVSSIASQGDQR